MAALRSADYFDLSPPTDSSPYFFSFVRFHAIPGILRIPGVHWEVLLPLLHLTIFMLAALILVILTIVWPARRWTRLQQGSAPAPAGAILYFIGIGLGFMLAEMGMMQQLSIFLGQPIYSLAVVLAGLILFAGLGSLASDRVSISSNLTSRRAGSALRAGAGGLFAGGSASHSRSRGWSLVAAHCRVIGVGRALRFHHGFLLPGRHALGNPARAGGKSALDVGAEWRGIRPGQFYCHGYLDGNFDTGLRAHGRRLLRAGGNPAVRQNRFHARQNRYGPRRNRCAFALSRRATA